MFVKHIVIMLVLSDLAFSETLCSTCSISKKMCQCYGPAIENLRSQLLEPKCSLQWQELRVTAPNLKPLPANVFANTKCTNLQTLELAGAQNFTAMPQGVFKDLINLRSLVLTFPRLTQLEAGSFKDAIALQSLVINNTRVEILQIGHLQGLDRLVNLKLKNNYINKLEVGVFNDTPSLQRLSIVGNKQITLSNHTFQGLSQLHVLTLTELFRIEPDAFAPLRKNLVELDIRANKVMLMNRIWSDLTHVFVGLEKLQILRLMDTRVMNSQLADDAFNSLSALRELNLQGNIFPHVSRKLLASVFSLEKLSLRDCKLQCVYNQNFNTLRKLQHLDLSNNLLTFLPRYLLTGLDSLTELRLNNNPLIKVQAGAFCGPHRLLLSSQAISQMQSQLNGSYQGANLTESCPVDVQADRSQVDTQCYHWSLISNKKSTSATLKDATNHTRDEYFFLLIIVAICVIFLLAAFGLILSYRAWSKRKNKQLFNNKQESTEAAKEMLPVVSIEAVFENRGAAKPAHKQRPTSSLIAAAAARERENAQGKQLVAHGTGSSTMSSSLTASSLLTPGHQIRSDADGTVITTLAVI